MPKVSIVLPTYNGVKWLKESIDSVINQSFCDWELIIVDDCSTDDTLSIANKYSSMDKRIHVIHNEVNKKLPASLNIGFRRAEGKYLTWTSDDNMYVSDALEKMVDFLDKNPKHMMVCTAMRDIDENNSFVKDRREYNDEIMFYNDYVGAGFMYRREVLDGVGEYDEKLFCVEDYDYWLRILIKYGTIGYINEILYIDRIHNNSLSVSMRDTVLKRRSVLRKKYLDIILDKLNKRPDLLTAIYFEFVEAKEDTVEIEAKFYKAVKELKKYHKDCGELDTSKHVIIYGAGDFGGRAYKLLGNLVCYFSDQNPKLVGTLKDNIPVISVEEMMRLKDDYNIVIAVSPGKVYELMANLYNNNVKMCYFYQDIIRDRV